MRHRPTALAAVHARPGAGSYTLTGALVLALVAALLAGGPPARADEEPVVITDVRIEMDDGVRLAADVHLPPGTPTDGSVQVPCVVELSPYRKELRAAEGASLLPHEGFGFLVVDVRGTGGSEGTYDIVFSLREQHDAAAVIDWVATESGWCGDRVGMFGGSYSGILQYLVAALPPEQAPQHLAAIAPQRAYGDLYRDIVYHGGQLIGSFGVTWSALTTALYLVPPTNIVSEDGLDAWTDHLTTNDPMLLPYIDNPYDDAVHTWEGTSGEHTQSLYRDSSVHPERMEHLSVPALHLAGWFDSFTRGQVLTFAEALRLERSHGDRGPNYLIVGPWNHGGTHFIDPSNFPDRLVDWYRHWLADGPEPEWFGEDRVLYYQMHNGALDDDTGEWRTAEDWPPPTEHTRLHLRHDGGLTTTEPEPDEGELSYIYDPSTGLAAYPSRWDNAALVPQAEWDQRLDGERSGLTFQTDELDEALEIVGPIVLRLHASTEGLGDGSEDPGDGPPVADQLTPPYHDTDWVVKVSDVAPDGTATLLSEGFLRASHRALDDDRSQTVDGEVVVPFHPHTRDELAPPPEGEVVEYLVEVWPTAKTFPAGHRIRVDLHSADTPNHLNLVRPALNTVHLSADQPSYLLLPVTHSEILDDAHEADTDPADTAIADASLGPDPAGPLPATGGSAGLWIVLAAAAVVIGRARRR